MSIEDVVEDLRDAYRALSEERKWPDPELDLKRLRNWEWKHEDELKERFFDRLSRSGVSASCRELFKKFEDPKAIENLSIGEDNVETALYNYLFIAATGYAACSWVAGSQGQALLLLLARELYCGKPVEYLQMFEIAMSKSSFPRWVNRLVPPQADKPWKDTFSRSSIVCQFLDSLSSQDNMRVIVQFCQDVDKEKKKDALFKFYFHFLELQSPKTAFHEAIDSKSPTIVGVNKAIHDTINIHLDRVEKDVEIFLNTDNEELEGASEVHSKDISIENSDDVHLLYAVSGSGKTRRIERLLHSQWGYYLLPGNVNPTEQRNCGNLYDPQREEYSKDSCVLWRLLREIDKIMPGMEIDKLQIRNWFHCLILSRHLIFDRFLKVAGKQQAMTPAKWLGFQKSCSISDPFKTLFKLLLLVNSGSKDLGYETPDLDPVLKENAFYYCLDEAQCCLDTPLPFSNIGRYKDENTLQLICGQILLDFKADVRFQNPGLRFIVSGTSLKLKETVSIIKGTQEWRETHEDIVSAKCETVTDFPLLTSAQELLNLIKERGLFQKIESDSDLVDEVKKCGVPLRGRYLWSALYVDHLKEHFTNHRKLDMKTILEAANKTIDEAKRSLKERLSRLQKEKYNDVLQELCWVVIQSDLLDMPTKFEKDEDHQMISEAFAVVEKSSSVGVLKERLAMEAAIEWFRKEQWDMYSGNVKKYLRFSANDASSFGKAAEWWLALELWHCLHHSNRVTGSEGEIRRGQILKTLSKASRDGKVPEISGGTRTGLCSSSPEPLKLASTHRLVEGKNIGHVYDGKTSWGFSSRGETPNLDHAVPIWEWMKSIRECKEPVASFYFPDTLAGPDILFSLELKDSVKSEESSFRGRIMCILQLKTGPIKKLRNAISTTNLQTSYQGRNKNRIRDKKKRELDKELENWKGATIIRVLVCTAKDYDGEKAVATYLKNERKTSSNELFFLCGKKYRGDLFGETFARLAEAKMAGESEEATLGEIIRKRPQDQEDTETNRKRRKN
ncbi:hypothetical protein HO133_005435 [Letharia lupina]|uniref:Uncharacterized protein n=1 Tax=Letharia lupina TaxID=560253 RepID=A0A8H6C8K6_9LECA|nr:uncharacterized protein HO133_005435 [Letharia lupina]KAF6218892.1 hypothetical protein HO133_005435 [Letharia lupina]